MHLNGLSVRLLIGVRKGRSNRGTALDRLRSSQGGIECDVKRFDESGIVAQEAGSGLDESATDGVPDQAGGLVYL